MDILDETGNKSKTNKERANFCTIRSPALERSLGMNWGTHMNKKRELLTCYLFIKLAYN